METPIIYYPFLASKIPIPLISQAVVFPSLRETDPSSTNPSRSCSDMPMADFPPALALGTQAQVLSLNEHAVLKLPFQATGGNGIMKEKFESTIALGHTHELRNS